MKNFFLKLALIFLFSFVFSASFIFSQQQSGAASDNYIVHDDEDLHQEEIDLNNYIVHHVADSNEWHPLPFIGIYFPEFKVGGYVFDKGLHATMVLLALVFLTLLFVFGYKKDSNKAPSGLTNLLEVLVLFVRDEIAIKNLGEEYGRRFAPFFLSLFFFILMLNVIGLVPFFSTASANINVTSALAAIIFIMMIFFGMAKKGPIGFFKTFIPSGVPAPILIVLFPIEFLGLFVKPLALLIRLFANMLAGHLIIFSILGIIITFGFFGLPSFFLALFIYLLEILVAFLQAYIFTLLSSMFLSEMVHEHH